MAETLVSSRLGNSLVFITLLDFQLAGAEEGKKEEREGVEPAAPCSCEEVKALSEELMAYESYMSFLGVPYMEGGAAAAVGAAAEEAPAELWSFEDSYYYPGPLGL